MGAGPHRAGRGVAPGNGAADLRFHVERATAAVHRGEPSDPDESARVEWVPLDELAGLLRADRIGDGLTVVALLAELAGLPGGESDVPAE